MSLDLYFYSNPKIKECRHCGHDEYYKEELFWKNITHNLTEMAEQCGVYSMLWRPYQWNEIKSKPKAEYMIDNLEKALSLLKSNPEYYNQFNAPNGWGTYKVFVNSLEEILEACYEYPNANIRASV